MIELLASIAINSNTIAYPFDTLAVVSSGYSESRFHPVLGYYRPHRAIDLVKPCGTPIKASISGKVTVAGWYGGYGIAIETANETQKIRIGHLSKTLVKVGDTVEVGQIIGNVGSSGHSTGCHAHLEAYLLNNQQQWQVVNPQLYFDKEQIARMK